MTIMLDPKTRTIECVVCSSAFTYAYNGGRLRRICDSADCDRQRNTQNRRNDRDRASPRPDGYVPDDYPVDMSAPVASGPSEPGDHPRIGELLNYGHGYGIDDYRDRDRKPLRLFPDDHQGAVETWFKTRGFPASGSWVGSTHKHRLPVIGQSSSPVYDGRVPPRIARRFCSETALPALTPFSRNL